MAGKRRSLEQRLVDERRRLLLVHIFEMAYNADARKFSEAVGKPWNHLRQLLKERGKGGHAMGEASARHLEDALDLPPGYFLAPKGLPTKEMEQEYAEFEQRLHQEELSPLSQGFTAYLADQERMDWTRAKRYGPRPIASRVPVVGSTPSKMEEGLWMDKHFIGPPIGFVEMCPKDKASFLVQVSDAAMAPRFHIGELALIEPSIDVEIEDDVLMRAKDGNVVLRRLLARRSVVKLGSYDSSPTLTVDLDRVDWIYLASHPMPARFMTPI